MTQGTSLLTWLVLRRDGRPRPLAERLLFQGDTGLPRLPFRRTLFKKSGAPRPGLAPELRRFLDEARLRYWVETVDQPAPAEAAAMAAQPRDMLFILDPGAAPPADHAALGPSLRALIGARRVSVAAWPPGQWIPPQMDGIAVTSLDPAAPPDTPDLAVFVLMGGSLPSPHGPWLLAEARGARALAHGDEVEGTAKGRLGTHWFKPPAWSPLLAAQGMLLDGLVALDLSDQRMRAAWDRALGHDWRAALAGVAGQFSDTEVAHVARVCAHSPRLDRTPLPLPAPALPHPLPKTAIVIPTRDRWDYLGPCLASLARTDWPEDRLQVIVVDNGSTQADCMDGMATAQAEGRITVIRCDAPFNFARLNNIAVAATDAEVLVFLNNDTTARRDDWLRILSGFALQPDIGAVGPKMTYADGTVQHGGVIAGIEGQAVNAFVDLPENDGGYAGLAGLTREVSAVTGACICLRSTVFDAIGGFNENLPVAYNDIVLCLDLLAAGYRNVYVADALFTHFEGRTRGRDTTPEKERRLRQERDLAMRLHPAIFDRDPYYSANLSRRVPFMLPGSRQELPDRARHPANAGDERATG